MLALQPAQGAQLSTRERVNARHAVLGPGNVQAGVNEIDLLTA